MKSILLTKSPRLAVSLSGCYFFYLTFLKYVSLHLRHLLEKFASFFICVGYILFSDCDEFLTKILNFESLGSNRKLKGNL